MSLGRALRVGWFTAFCGLANSATAQGNAPPGAPPAPQQAIVPEIKIDQDKLDDGTTPLPRIILAGRHLFSTPFTKDDGAGEGVRDEAGRGALGPREMDYNDRVSRFVKLLPADTPKDKVDALRRALAPPTALRKDGQPILTVRGELRFDFLRVNGLDSQSCFECHNSIGSAHLAGQGRPEFLTRKVGVNGGPAGFASDAFIGEAIPSTAKPSDLFPFTSFLRNPPHVFGTGYAQKLAEEMSHDLLLLKESAIGEAVDNPGKRVMRRLTSKGTEFGEYAITYRGPKLDAADAARNAVLGGLEKAGGNFVEDFTGVKGVSEDLVVRPFQWKGIASNERNFVRSAMNFHFGMFPRELHKGYMTPKEEHDPDGDGKLDEVSEGEVSSLTIFTMLLRPPTIQPAGPGKEVAVARGRALFTGVDQAGNQLFPKAESCASCHTPALRINSSTICVRDPRDDPKDQEFENVTGLVAAQKRSANLPVVRQFRRIEQELHDKAPARRGVAPELFLNDFRATAKAVVGCPGRGYHFDLSLKSGESEEAQRSFSHSYPRLPENADGSINVPLFSDLKRHDMGEGLADRFAQTTDVMGIQVAPREFLTRPLWGVADTGPWLHDGRARTLREAIVLHKSAGSEANRVIDRFMQLPPKDQEALIEFLLTFRLPLDPRYHFDQD